MRSGYLPSTKANALPSVPRPRSERLLVRHSRRSVRAPCPGGNAMADAPDRASSSVTVLLTTGARPPSCAHVSAAQAVASSSAISPSRSVSIARRSVNVGISPMSTTWSRRTGSGSRRQPVEVADAEVARSDGRDAAGGSTVAPGQTAALAVSDRGIHRPPHDSDSSRSAASRRVDRGPGGPRTRGSSARPDGLAVLAERRRDDPEVIVERRLERPGGHGLARVRPAPRSDRPARWSAQPRASAARIDGVAP